MPDNPAADGFLDAYRGIFAMFVSWVGELASHFDDETALVRPHEKLNHALWLVGHITWLTDALIMEMAAGQPLRNREWDAWFKIGAPRAKDGDYPPYPEVREHFDRVRKGIEEHLEALTPGDLDTPLAEGSDWLTSPFHALLHALRDGNYHLGQLSSLAKTVEEARRSPGARS